MSGRRLKRRLLSIGGAVVVLLCASTCMVGGAADAAKGAQRALARKILSDTGVAGGLIVHIGCGDGTLTAALRENERYLVHGLDVGAETVDAARAQIRAMGLYGPVSVDAFDGERLPYVDGLVNLVVAEDLGKVPMRECQRVLAPRGVVYVKSRGRWKMTV
ncbi:MAG: class I SAM-dependent methyltransferase, partial [Armatimonadota bacterium]